MDIISLGEVLIDLTMSSVDDDGIKLFKAFPGGAPANLAVAAKRLGADTSFIGRVGNDYFASILVDTLVANGVDVDNVQVDNQHPTTLAIVSVDKEGERSFSFYRDNSADVNLEAEEIDFSKFKDAKILHFGSLSLTHEKSKQATYKAIKAAKDLDLLISFDPNYRDTLWSSEADFKEEVLKVLDKVDVLKIADDEIALLSSEDNVKDAAKDLLKTYGLKMVIVTLGAEGAYLQTEDFSIRRPGIEVKVADTNGAGDTFFAAFLSKLVNYDSLAEIDEDEYVDILDFSNKAAAITTSRSGAIPAMPYLREVE